MKLAILNISLFENLNVFKCFRNEYLLIIYAGLLNDVIFCHIYKVIWSFFCASWLEHWWVLIAFRCLKTQYVPSWQFEPTSWWGNSWNVGGKFDKVWFFPAKLYPTLVAQNSKCKSFHELGLGCLLLMKQIYQMDIYMHENATENQFKLSLTMHDL